MLAPLFQDQQRMQTKKEEEFFMWHEFKRDSGFVLTPMKEEWSAGHSGGNPYKKTFHNQHAWPGAFSVEVRSSRHNPPLTIDAILNHSNNETYTNSGPTSLSQIHSGATGSRGLASDSSTQLRPGDSLIVCREDHEMSTRYDQPTRDKQSTTKANIFYNADPFSYASSSSAMNQNSLGFKDHKELLAETVPSMQIANRVDLIDALRLKGRQTIKAIEGGNVDATVISMASQVSGAAVEAATGHGGLVAAAIAGKAGAVVAGLPFMAAGTILNHVAQRLSRSIRLSDALSDRQDIAHQLETTLPAARRDLGVYLNHVDNLVFPETKEHLISTWSKTDRLLPRYLRALSSIDSSGGSVVKKFAQTGTCLVAHELKYSILAETRLLIDAKIQVRRARERMT